MSCWHCVQFLHALVVPVHFGVLSQWESQHLAHVLGDRVWGEKEIFFLRSPCLRGECALSLKYAVLLAFLLSYCTARMLHISFYLTVCHLFLYAKYFYYKVFPGESKHLPGLTLWQSSSCCFYILHSGVHTCSGICFFSLQAASRDSASNHFSTLVCSAAPHYFPSVSLWSVYRIFQTGGPAISIALLPRLLWTSAMDIAPGAFEKYSFTWFTDPQFLPLPRLSTQAYVWSPFSPSSCFSLATHSFLY